MNRTAEMFKADYDMYLEQSFPMLNLTTKQFEQLVIASVYYACNQSTNQPTIVILSLYPVSRICVYIILYAQRKPCPYLNCALMRCMIFTNKDTRYTIPPFILINDTIIPYINTNNMYVPWWYPFIQERTVDNLCNSLRARDLIGVNIPFCRHLAYLLSLYGELNTRRIGQVSTINNTFPSLIILYYIIFIIDGTKRNRSSNSTNLIPQALDEKATKEGYLYKKGGRRKVVSSCTFCVVILYQIEFYSIWIR